MTYLGWMFVCLIAAAVAYRFGFGKWPVKLDL